MSSPHSAYTAALAVVRGCYGGCQLVAPELEAALAPLDASRIRWVVRVAGAREAAQLAWCLADGEQARLWGIAVDALHALTMLAVAAASSRYRRPAVLEGLVAAGFALAGARRSYTVRPGRSTGVTSSQARPQGATNFGIGRYTR